MVLPRRVVPVRVHSKLPPAEVLERIAALHARDDSFWSRRRALLSRVEGNRCHLDRDGGRNLR